jgi:hypothetical protein
MPSLWAEDTCLPVGREEQIEQSIEEPVIVEKTAALHYVMVAM